MLIRQSAVASERVGERKGEVQELGNCPFEGTVDDCTGLNQRIKRGGKAQKRGVCVTGDSGVK